MKFNILFVILLWSTPLLLAQPLSSSPQPTRITERRNLSDSLENYLRTTQYFNGSGHLINTRVERWEVGQWTLDETTLVAPNADGQPAQITHYTKFGTESRRQYFTYDANGRLTLWEDEFNYSGTWVKINRKVRSYTPDGQYIVYRDETGNVLEPFSSVAEAIREYDAQYKEIKFTYKQTYNGTVQVEREIASTYDSQGRLGTTIARNKNSGGTWVNQEKREYNYDNSNRVTYVKVYDWNNANNAWNWPAVSDVGYTYYPDRTVFVLNPTGSFQHYRGTTYFNTEGQKTRSTGENWSNSFQTLQINTEEQWTYNSDGSYNSYKYLTRKTNQPLVTDESETLYEYQLFVSTDDQYRLAKMVQVYPNPTTDRLIVDLSNCATISYSTPVVLQLIDATGRVISTEKSTDPRISLSLANQTAGCYYLRIQQDDAVVTLPVIKQ